MNTSTLGKRSPNLTHSRPTARPRTTVRDDETENAMPESVVPVSHNERREGLGHGLASPATPSPRLTSQRRRACHRHHPCPTMSSRPVVTVGLVLAWTPEAAPRARERQAPPQRLSNSPPDR